MYYYTSVTILSLLLFRIYTSRSFWLPFSKSNFYFFGLNNTQLYKKIKFFCLFSEKNFKFKKM